jgi:hypothetical protein
MPGDLGASEPIVSYAPDFLLNMRRQMFSTCLPGSRRCNHGRTATLRGPIR